MSKTDRKLCPFSWFGGKNSHLRWLLPIIDGTPHKAYVEPFGGSAAVLLNKAPSPVEVYNDLYGDVVNFFRVLRSAGQQLVAQLELTPYSHEEFTQACNLAKQETTKTDTTESPEVTPLERARLFFVRARQVRNGLATTARSGQWSSDRTHHSHRMAISLSRWLGAIDGLLPICERLRAVQLENIDALRVLERYDTEETLHYLDPPYLMTTRKSPNVYKYEMTTEQHLELLQKIKTLKGKVLLSGYDSPLYNDTLHDWHVYKPDNQSAASARQTMADRQEIIWSNYQLPILGSTLVQERNMSTAQQPG